MSIGFSGSMPRFGVQPFSALTDRSASLEALPVHIKKKPQLLRLLRHLQSLAPGRFPMDDLVITTPEGKELLVAVYCKSRSPVTPIEINTVNLSENTYRRYRVNPNGEVTLLNTNHTGFVSKEADARLIDLIIDEIGRI